LSIVDSVVVERLQKAEGWLKLVCKDEFGKRTLQFCNYLHRTTASIGLAATLL
jgi:hypothetical protein